MTDASAKKRGRRSKIDLHDLGSDVLGYVKQGLTSYAIASRLTADGYPISQPTVSRWIAESRKASQSKAQQLFSDHIDRELPKDLEALEEMEALCLAWAREDKAARCARLMAGDRVAADLELIASELVAAYSEPDEKKQKAAIGFVVKKVLGWVLADNADQKRRLDAMAMGTKIIGSKLQHAGVLEGKEDWGVTIKPYDDSAPLGSEAEAGGNRLFSVTAPEPTDGDA